MTEYQEESEHFLASLLKETARGAVLVAQSNLDSWMEMILRERLRNPDDDTAGMINSLFVGEGLPPFQSFRMKLKMMRLLRLIDKDTFNAMSKLNQLRRHFAHHPGSVSLTRMRVKRIRDLLNKESKRELPEIVRILARIDDLPKRRHNRAHTEFVHVVMAIEHVLVFTYAIVHGKQEGGKYRETTLNYQALFEP